ncbi:uncharacterized protein LOC125664123 [Ostrea edulis]|uniref:uncharacterized protein LOC125664123 n=1 Tax=Ostrea edulis TaxID=37623 RepID=UPI002094D024|nr:uncharacterized protein LOC125664123 [Ostrea edulis]
MVQSRSDIRVQRIFARKTVHLKIIALCALCMLIYMHLYSKVSLQALANRDLIEGALNDFRSWKENLLDWWAYTSKWLINDEEFMDNERNIIQNYSSTLVPRSALYVESNFSNIPKYVENLALELLNANKTLLTLFTTWKVSTEKYTCHNNTVKNWNLLKPFVQPIMFTNEADLSGRVASMGWKVLPISKTRKGVPVLKHMYLDTISVYNSTFYAYANGDILFTDTLLITLMAILNSSVNKSHPLMIIGRRTNVDNVTSTDAENQSTLIETTDARGSLFTAWGEDYFITMKNFPWKDIPEVIVGRRAYDNWLVLDARKRGNVIDATETLLAVHQTTIQGNYEGLKHQDKDYNHNLLVKMYRHLHYAAGKTSCAEFITRYNVTDVPNIQRRKIDQECFPL